MPFYSYPTGTERQKDRPDNMMFCYLVTIKPPIGGKPSWAGGVPWLLGSCSSGRFPFSLPSPSTYPLITCLKQAGLVEQTNNNWSCSWNVLEKVSRSPFGNVILRLILAASNKDLPTCLPHLYITFLSWRINKPTQLHPCLKKLFPDTKLQESSRTNFECLFTYVTL